MRSTVTFFINALWQLPLLLLLTHGIDQIIPRSRPLVRHRLWVGCLFLSILVPLFSITVSSQFHIGGLLWMRTEVPGTFFHDAVLLYSTGGVAPQPWVYNCIAVVFWLYLSGVVIAIVRFICSLWCIQRALNSSIETPLPPALRRRLLDAVGGHKYPRICSTAQCPSPATVSWPAPILLLPIQFESISTRDAAAAVGHEAAHILRNDFFFNLLYELMLVPLFFHPIAYQLKARIDLSRELVCDQFAAERNGGAVSYARSLMNLVKFSAHSGWPMSLSLGVLQVSDLELRFKHLLHSQDAWTMTRRISMVGATICLLLTSFGAVFVAPRILLGETASPTGVYPVLAIAHGTGVSLQVNRRDVFVHRWLGTDRQPYAVVSTAEPDPSTAERLAIERRYHMFHGAKVLTRLPEAQGSSR